MALIPARVQWSPDGTLSSLDYGDVYFQRGKGLAESRYVFIEKNRLEERFSTADVFRIGELGFGSGLNFLLTAALFAKTAPGGARLVYAAIEKHPIARQDIEKIHACFPELASFSKELQEQYPPLISGFHRLTFLGGRVTLLLLFGDVAAVLPEMSGRFDAWFLDGFMPARNPDMWSEDVCRQVFERAAPGCTLSTFSSVGKFRRTLAAAGFRVRREKGFGHKYHMTVAEKDFLSPSPLVGEGRGEGSSHDKTRLENSARMSPPPHPTPLPQGERERVKTVLIAGAGIAGCAAARALAEKGFAVTVVDRHSGPAGGTSGNPVAIVYPKLTVDDSAMGRYHSHAFCFTRNLLRRLALPSWNPCGVLHLDMDDEDRKRTAALFEKQAFPEDFAHQTPEGYMQPQAGYLSPPEFCRHLLDHPLIKTVFNADAKGFTADIRVIAQGTESAVLSETRWLPLQSLRGQITFLKENARSKDINHVVCHDGYITPAISGLHYIGATFQKEPSGDVALRAQDDAENVAKLNKVMPEWGFTIGDVAGARAGYRATTPDKLPLIGPCPDRDAFIASDPRVFENLYLATGFGAHGMTGAPLAGEIIACLIAGDPLPVPLSLYAHLKPERFILRELRRGAASLQAGRGRGSGRR